MSETMSAGDMLWVEATRDVASEHEAGLLTAASVQAAPLWSMVLDAESVDDFHNRVALLGDSIHSVASAVAKEGTPDHTYVLAALPAQWFEDWQIAHEARQAETQRKNARRAFERRRKEARVKEGFRRTAVQYAMVDIPGVGLTRVEGPWDVDHEGASGSRPESWSVAGVVDGVSTNLLYTEDRAEFDQWMAEHPMVNPDAASAYTFDDLNWGMGALEASNNSWRTNHQAAREDYEHWNEDADRIWWEEEGRHGDTGLWYCDVCGFEHAGLCPYESSRKTASGWVQEAPDYWVNRTTRGGIEEVLTIEARQGGFLWKYIRNGAVVDSAMARTLEDAKKEAGWGDLAARDFRQVSASHENRKTSVSHEYLAKIPSEDRWRPTGATDWEGAVEFAKTLLNKASPSTIVWVKNPFNESVSVLEISPLAGGSVESIWSFEQFYGQYAKTAAPKGRYNDVGRQVEEYEDRFGPDDSYDAWKDGVDLDEDRWGRPHRPSYATRKQAVQFYDSRSQTWYQRPLPPEGNGTYVVVKSQDGDFGIANNETGEVVATGYSDTVVASDDARRWSANPDMAPDGGGFNDWDGLTPRRAASGDPAFIAACREVVARQASQDFDGMVVDLFTASAVIQVYDSLSDANKARLGSFDPVKLVDTVWKLVNKTKAASKTSARDWGEGVVGSYMLGFPGSKILSVEPTAGYLMNGPVKGHYYDDAAGGYVTYDFDVTFETADGRVLTIGKTYRWLEDKRQKSAQSSRTAAESFPPKNEADPQEAPQNPAPAAPGVPQAPVDPRVDVGTAQVGGIIMEPSPDGSVNTYLINEVTDEGETVRLSVTKNGTEDIELQVPKTEKLQIHQPEVTEAQPEVAEEPEETEEPEVEESEDEDEDDSKSKKKSKNPFPPKKSSHKHASIRCPNCNTDLSGEATIWQGPSGDRTPSGGAILTAQCPSCGWYGKKQLSASKNANSYLPENSPYLSDGNNPYSPENAQRAVSRPSGEDEDPGVAVPPTFEDDEED